MNKTNGRTDGCGNPADGTHEKGRTGRFPGFRVLLAGVLAGCMAWGSGVARGQGLNLNPDYIRWMQGQLSSKNARTNTFKKFSPRKVVGDKPWARIAETQTPIIPEDGGFGLVPPLIDYSYLNGISISQFGLMDSGTIPSAWDSREYGWITSIKRQNAGQDHFGTCWAHATMANLETIMRIQNPSVYDDNALPDLSENNMVLQTGYDSKPGSGMNLYTSGGSFDAAMAYLTRWEGPIDESEDVYPTPENGYATQNSDVHGTPVCHVQKSLLLPQKSKPLDHDEIKRAVMKHGVVWVSYCADSRIQTQDGYTLPFLAEDGKSFFNWFSRLWQGKLRSNHAVALIGWDDDYPAENFACFSSPGNYALPIPEGNGAYLIKNSWGTASGDEGYYWVSYYDDNMLYDASYVIPAVENVDNYGDVYFHDSLGNVITFPYSGYGWAANVFTAKEACEIAAVGFYSMSPGTKYTIYVRSNVDADNPVTGTVLDSSGQSGRSDYAGYVTVPLKATLSVGKGKRFSVIVKLSSPNCDYPLATEVDLHLKQRNWVSFSRTSDATASKGESFVSADGETWIDLTTIHNIEWEDVQVDTKDDGTPIYDNVIYLFSTANFCIKAYTKSKTAEKPTLTGVAIRGDKSVESGKTGQYTCDATYSGKPKEEGVAATWSVVKGKDWATIGKTTGLLQAKEVTETQTVTIRAEYTEDGVTKTADGDVQITAGAPEIPTGVSASSDDTQSVCVEWNASKGATEYAVYRGTADDSEQAGFLGSVANTSYWDTKAVPGEEYWYFVKAKNGSGTSVKASGFSGGAKGLRLLSAPGGLKATTDLEGRIEVSWDESEGATHYLVERQELMAHDRQAVSGWQTSRVLDDKTAECGVTYQYYVSAAKDGSGRLKATGLSFATGRMKCPAYPEKLLVKGPDSLGSGEYGEYEAYAVWSNGREDTIPVAESWSVSAGSVQTSGRKGIVTAPVVSANGEITVTAKGRVSWSGGMSTLTGSKTVTVKAGVPGKVTGLHVTSATAAGVGLAWDASAGANGYAIARTGGSGGAVTFKTAGTEYTDTTAGPGVEYSYTVAAENAAGTGEASGALEAFIALSAPGGVSATSDRTDGVLVKWAATAGATHYRVGRAENEGGEKTELGSWQGGREYLDTEAAAGKEYWYSVKAATEADGTHAGGWSAAAKGTRKAEKTLMGLSVSGPDRVGSGERAVYACEAFWNDGENRTVSASWSAVGGTIGSDGGFTAVETESDVAGRVVAAYGGMAATQEVTIVGAAIEATAELSDVSVAQRWPFAGLVDIGYTLATHPAGTKAVVSVSAWDEDHGRALAATSLAGDGADGAPLEAGSHRVTWNLAADHPDFHAAGLRVDVAAAVASLAAPEGVTLIGGLNGITVGWNTVDGATGYEVWRGMSEDEAQAVRVGTPTETEWTDSEAEAGRVYWYWVKAVASFGQSEFSGAASAVRPLATPVVKATEGANGVDLTWSAVPGATSYEAWRGMTNSLETASRIGTPTATSFNDTTATPGTRYGYWVRAVCGNSTSEFSAVAIAGRTILPPTNVVASDGTSLNGIVITWSAVAGANFYQVFRAEGSPYSFKLLTNTTSLSCTDTNVSLQYVYYYKVCAVGADFTSGYSEQDTGCMGLVAPTGVSATQGDSWTGVTVTWSNVTGASSYSIWRSTSSSSSTATYVGSSSRLEYTDSEAQSGITYYYWVKACSQGGARSEFSSSATGYKPAMSSVVITGASSVTGGGAADYVVQALCHDGIVRPMPGVANTTLTLSDNYGCVTTGLRGSLGSLLDRLMGRTRVTVTNPPTSGSWPVTLNAICTNNGVVYTGNKTVNVKPAISGLDMRYCIGMGGTVAVTNYTGTATSVSVPSTINGFPVVELTNTFQTWQSTLQSVALPSSLLRIGDRSFWGCSGLTSLSIPSGVIYIGANAFVASGVGSISIPAATTNIVDRAFSYATSLKSIAVNSGNPSYSSISGVLYSKDGTNLKAYPSGKTGAFAIPSGVTNICIGTFWGNRGLTSVSIPGSMKRFVGSYVNPFRDCPALASISVESSNPSYCSSGNVLFAKDLSELICYPAAKAGSSYTLPSSVRIIESQAFDWATKLKTLDIPGSVTNIGCALSGCTNLIALRFFGDAPTTSGLFDSSIVWDDDVRRAGFGDVGDVTATVYYFPETSGWSSKFSGLTTVAWDNPIQSLTVDGPSTVQSGAQASYIGKGTFKSGHSDVACKVAWSIATGAEYAEIAEDGTLTAKAVEITQAITVRATTTLGGASRTATKTVTITP